MSGLVCVAKTGTTAKLEPVVAQLVEQSACNTRSRIVAFPFPLGPPISKCMHACKSLWIYSMYIKTSLNLQVLVKIENTCMGKHWGM
jgi:hypothetical protein